MGVEVFDQEVRTRVPKTWKRALKKLAKRDAKPGDIPTESAPIRAALFEYFAKRKIKLGAGRTGINGNGKADAS